MARNSRMKTAACAALSLVLALSLSPARAGAVDPAADATDPTTVPATAEGATDDVQVPAGAPTPDATSPATGATADDLATPTTDDRLSETEPSATPKDDPDEKSQAPGPTDESSNDESSAADATGPDLAAALGVAADATESEDDIEDLDPLEGLEVQASPLVDGTTASVSRTSTLASFTTGGTKNVAQLETTALYRLVTVGAHGGNWVWNKTTTYGGSGGSTTAVTPIDAGATPNLYVVCGGRGVDATNMSEHPGGANGGGNGGKGATRDTVNYYGGGSGGGASHIATQPGSLPEFGTAAGVEASVLLIAGGGGGCGGGNEPGKNYTGGAGGGVKGGNGGVYSGNSMVGGSQAEGSGSKAIGQGTNGGAGTNKDHGAEGHGGGGGGYWGGAAKTSTGKSTKASGAGGSGYLNGTLLQGSKASDGGSVEWGGLRVASTTAGVGAAGGTASVEYLASIVTLDDHDADHEGTQTLYAAPQDNAYYTAYSIDGLASPIERIETPARDGWAFKGYYTQPDGGGERYVAEDGTIEAGLFSQGTVTLHAWWWPTVTFDDNGVVARGVPETMAVRPGEPATRPADPEADGHGFKGWSTDDTLYRYFDFAKPVTEPTVLFAFWSPHVEFDLHGHGGEIEPQFLQKGASGQRAQRPEDPTEDGYTFGGWYTDETFAEGTEFDFDTEITTDTTLYAKWSANEYTVEFVDDGNVVGREDFVYDTAAKPLTTASELEIAREGWSFAGWRAGEELQVDFKDGQEVRNISTETGVLEFHAVWQRDINFHATEALGLASRLAAESALAPQATSDTTLPQLTDGASYSSVTTPILPASGAWQGVGWVASEVAASAADVAAGESFMPMATEYFGLYHRELHLAFDGNGATSGTMDDLVDLQRMNASGQITSVTFVLPQNAFEREGHSFRAWDLGDPGDAVTLKPAANEGATTTARALWDALPTPEGPGDPADPAQPQDRRSPSPATGDGPTWPAALAAILAAATLVLGISRRTRKYR